MKIWLFLKQIFKQKKEDDNLYSDLDRQIKQHADLFVKEYKGKFPNLNYSLESLTVVDKVLNLTQTEENWFENDNFSSRCESVVCYILHTLKGNYKGETLWNDHKEQPLFLFNDNDYEFYPYRYLKSQINKNKKVDILGFISKFKAIE